MLQRVKLSCFACFVWAVLATLSGCSSSSTPVGTKDGGPDAKSDASDGGADSTAPPDTGGMDSTIGSDTSATDTSAPDTSSSDTSMPDTSVPDTSMDAPADTTPVTDSNTADTSPTDSQAPTFTVGGTIAGTNGLGVTLQDNGTDNITVSMDGAFTFPTPLASGAAFNVTVLSTAGGLSCVVTGGLGTIAGGNVSTVSITCTVIDVDSGSMDTGVADTGTTDTGAADTGAADTGAADTGTADTGTVDSGTVDSGTIDSGTVDSGGPTTTVGGTIMGLAPGDSVEVELNGGDGTFIGSNGAFVFSMQLPAGAMYAVSIKSNPATPTAQDCTIANGVGTVGAMPVNSVAITCVTAKFTIGGAVTYAAIGPDTITLRDNGGDDVVIPAGTVSPVHFTFPTALLSGSAYSVTAFATGSDPITCTAQPVGTMFQGIVATAPAMGTVANQNITGILIKCQ